MFLIFFAAYTLRFLMEGHLRTYSQQASVELLRSFGIFAVVSLLIGVFIAWMEQKNKAD
jgi:hypothetical protein